MTVSDSYLAGPSDTCCLGGTIHQGEPRGEYVTISNIQTYVSKPSETKANGHILLYFPDVWGMFKNGLLVMDAFAEFGFMVLGLDYFRGDPVTKHRTNRHDTTTDPEFDYEAWKAKHTSFAEEAVPRWVSAVSSQYADSGTKFACVGYCFGAPYVCNELAKGGICSVGAFGHPAFLKEHHFENLMNENKKLYNLQLFSGVEHGFALRGDMNKPYERWVKEESLRSIAQWLTFWLAQ
ncbi:hypothetical protein JX265_013065 [Neoarthrinium moseri]|uniref:Dienelactone hydrolase domain-containing protein n=1 Tax=Neoarthrinium moseri TaxID=1658444 RepID=A0A9P9W957_9PEZI|nr:hypothetical protein JX265_013065 [Neoarthrinium moseri]